MKPSCALVVTTMNDLGGLRSIWWRIPFNLFSRVIVVDGRSTDGTLEWLNRLKKNFAWLQVHVQTLPGRGNGIKEALADVTEDAVMVVCSDGNDDPRYMSALLDKFNEGYDLVTGSRFMRGGTTDDSDDPFRIRKLGNRFFTFLVNLFWNAKITDSTYSFRVFTLDAWRNMNMNCQRHHRFETEYMMSIRAAKLGLKVAQIPMIECQRAAGQRKARTLPLASSFLKLLFSELRS